MKGNSAPVGEKVLEPAGGGDSEPPAALAGISSRIGRRQAGAYPVA